MLSAKKFLVFCLLAVPTTAVAQQRAAFGPIETIGRSSFTITVLGQTFAINSATRVAVNGTLVPAGVALASISIGQRVYVEGIDASEHSVATSIDVVKSQYVPGATAVHVLGTVVEMLPNAGVVRIGSLRIDSSTIDPSLMGRLRIGATVQVSGIQPSPNGVLVGPIQLVIGGSGSQLQSIGGSGAQLQSIGGSGKLSIGGSGSQLQSIGGSGTQLQSIGGSGSQLQSIGGSELR
jgi:hypothetical protein